MSKTVFDILGIEPTVNFTMVKRAYIHKARELHPDLYLDPLVKIEKTKQFAELASAWELVDNQRKLEQYFTNRHTGIYPDQYTQDNQTQNESTSASHAGFSEFSDSLRVPKIGFVNVFIPVLIYDEEQFKDFPNFNKDGTRFPLIKIGDNPDTNQFKTDFNYKKLAEILINQSKRYSMQVGVTPEEAKDIVNQHSHRAYTVIVEVNIPATCLSDFRASEAMAYGGGVLNAGGGKFFWLEMNTQFNDNDIISVRPMTRSDYENSQKFGKINETRITSIDKLWPEKLVVSNPCAIKPALEDQSNPLNNKNTQPETPQLIAKSTRFEEKRKSVNNPTAISPSTLNTPDKNNSDMKNKKAMPTEELPSKVATISEAQVSLLDQLALIKAKSKQLKEDGHNAAAEAARTLYKAINTSYDKFIKKNEITQQQFEKDCSAAIFVARPELEKIHDWNQILKNLLLAVVGLGVLYVAAGLINKAVTGKFLFFKTDLENMIDTTETKIDSVINPKN